MVRRRLVVVLAALMLFSGIGITHAAAWEPRRGSTFNVPRPWGSAAQQSAILRTVEAAIRRTPKGETILIASYLLDRGSSVTELIRACRRGVSVQVILDGHIASGQHRRLIGALNGDNIRRNGKGGWTKPKTGRCGRKLPSTRIAGKIQVSEPLTRREIVTSLRATAPVSKAWGRDKSYVRKCRGSCRGGGANMHAKYYAFSRTGKARNVVMISSSNLNDGGASRGWNDMYTIKKRPKTFALYQRVHREMAQDDQGDDQGKIEVVDGPYISRFFPWPGSGRRGDPVIKDLNKVGCRGPAGRTQVHVAMFYWKGKRGNYITTKLLSLARQGCRVSIIYGAPSRQMADRLRAAARSGRVAVFDSRKWLNEDSEVDVRTHSKYILVKGRYGRDGRSWQVMTSTANWTPGSLRRCDENSLNIASASAWRQYKRNWDAVRRHSRKVPFN